MMTTGGATRYGSVAERVRAALDEVTDPCSVAAGTPLGMDQMGLVESVAVDGGQVTVAVRLTSPSCMMLGWFIDAITERVNRIAGVEAVEVVFDRGLDWGPERMRPEVRERREKRFRLSRRTATLDGEPAGAVRTEHPQSRS